MRKPRRRLPYEDRITHWFHDFQVSCFIGEQLLYSRRVLV